MSVKPESQCVRIVRKGLRETGRHGRATPIPGDLWSVTFPVSGPPPYRGVYERAELEFAGPADTTADQPDARPCGCRGNTVCDECQVVGGSDTTHSPHCDMPWCWCQKDRPEEAR